MSYCRALTIIHRHWVRRHRHLMLLLRPREPRILNGLPYCRIKRPELELGHSTPVARCCEGKVNTEMDAGRECRSGGIDADTPAQDRRTVRSEGLGPAGGRTL